MANDKCPKCGANRKRGDTPEFDCGTYFYPTGELWYQHELCETRCDLAAAKKELAELKERHQRLAEAARRVVDQYNNGDRAYGVDEFELRIEMLEKALESEAKNG